MPVVDLNVSAAVLPIVLCLPGERFRVVGRDGDPLGDAQTITFQIEVDSAPRGARQLDPCFHLDTVTGRTVLTEIMWRDADGALLVTEEFDAAGLAVGGYFHTPLGAGDEDGEEAGALPPVVSFSCPCPIRRVDDAPTPEQAWQRRHTPHCTGPTQVVITTWSNGALTEASLTRAVADAIAKLRPAPPWQAFTVEQFRANLGLPPLRDVHPADARQYELGRAAEPGAPQTAASAGESSGQRVGRHLEQTGWHTPPAEPPAKDACGS